MTSRHLPRHSADQASFSSRAGRRVRRPTVTLRLAGSRPRARGCGSSPEEQVDVVRHEAVCVNVNLVPFSIQRQSVEIGIVVGFAEERRLALVPAGDDVIEEAGRKEPGAASPA